MAFTYYMVEVHCIVFATAAILYYDMYLKGASLSVTAKRFPTN